MFNEINVGDLDLGFEVNALIGGKQYTVNTLKDVNELEKRLELREKAKKRIAQNIFEKRQEYIIELQEEIEELKNAKPEDDWELAEETLIKLESVFKL